MSAFYFTIEKTKQTQSNMDCWLSDDMSSILSPLDNSESQISQGISQTQ